MLFYAALFGIRGDGCPAAERSRSDHLHEQPPPAHLHALAGQNCTGNVALNAVALSSHLPCSSGSGPANAVDGAASNIYNDKWCAARYGMRPAGGRAPCPFIKYEAAMGKDHQWVAVYEVVHKALLEDVELDVHPPEHENDVAHVAEIVTDHLVGAVRFEPREP